MTSHQLSSIQISLPVRMRAKGRPEGGAIIETVDGKHLTISTADPLYRDIEGGRNVRVKLLDCWSEPLIVRATLKGLATGATKLTVATPRSVRSPFIGRLASELLGNGTSLANVKKAGLPIPNLSREVVVRRARPDELEKIIELRTLAYSHDGKHATPGAMTDEFDAGAVHLCALFCGRPVAALRLMLPEEGKPSEHQQLFTWPQDFPKISEIADITRVCVQPDFRRCRLLEALFQRAASEVLCCGRQWMLGSSSEKLLPMYRRIGCIAAPIQWSDPQVFGGIIHTVFLCDVRAALLGRANPIVWLFLWRSVARALLQDGLLTPRTLFERLRLNAMLGVARVVDLFAE